jgi:hypothetical protein
MQTGRSYSVGNLNFCNAHTFQTNDFRTQSTSTCQFQLELSAETYP